MNAPHMTAPARIQPATLFSGIERAEERRTAVNPSTTHRVMSTGQARTSPPARAAKSPETGPPAAYRANPATSQ